MTKKYVAAALILFVLAEAGVAQPSTVTLPSNLPVCVNSESDIAEIQRVQKANPKVPQKYDGYRTIFHAAPPLELAARLAYAETLAANCPDRKDKIAGLITSVIGNRVRIRGGDVGSVVFQRDQFASSLNIYPESRYRDFLCPNNRKLWNSVVTAMHHNLEGAKPTAPIPGDAVNYYLYQHSERLKAPDWKLAEVQITDDEIRKCIRVFRNPAWK